MKRLVTALAFVIATSVSAFAQSFPATVRLAKPARFRHGRLPGTERKLYWQLFQPRGWISVSKRTHESGPVQDNRARERQFGHFQRRLEQRHCELQFSDRMDWNAAGPNAYDEVDSDWTGN
jgi:hypothetical protein